MKFASSNKTIFVNLFLIFNALNLKAEKDDFYEYFVIITYKNFLLKFLFAIIFYIYLIKHKSDVKFSNRTKLQIIIPLKEPFMPDKRFARRVVISMNTWSATNCKAVFGDESASFFKSIPSNIIDFIDCIDLFVNKQRLKEFIFQLNQNSLADDGQGNIFLLFFRSMEFQKTQHEVPTF